MKILKKILIGLALVVSSSLVTSVGLIGIVIVRPQVLLNIPFLEWARPVTSRFGYDVTWGNMDIGVRSPGLLHKAVDLKLENACVGFSGKKNVCFGSVSLAFEVQWKDGLKFPSVGPLSAQRGYVSLIYDGNKTPETKPATGRGWPLDLPALVLPGPFRDTRFKAIAVDVDSLAVLMGNKLYAGAAALSSPPDDDGRLGDVALQADLFEGLGLKAFSASAHLKSDSRFHDNDWVLDLGADLRQRDDLSATAELEVTQIDSGAFLYDLQTQATIGRGKYRLTADGGIASGLIDGTLTASVEGLEPLHRATALACPLHYAETSPGSGRGDLDFHCPIHVDLSPLQLPSATWKKVVTLPYNLDLIVNLGLETDLVPAPDSRVAGNLDLKLVPLSQDLLNARGSIRTKFSGAPAHYPEGWSIVSDFDAAVSLNRFHRLAEVLDPTAFAIPAPLNALDGTVEIGLTGRSNVIQNTGKVPITFKTRLKSPDQSFDTDGKGEMTYSLTRTSAKSKLTLDLDLSDLQLVLPRFGFSSLPNLLMDGRIRKPDTAKRTGPEFFFDYELKVRTPKNPARLVAGVFEQSLPVFLDLNVQREQIEGQIKLGMTQLQLFKKKATLEGLTITLADPLNMSEVDGRARAIYSDYRIDVLVQGTVGKPVVLFESTPPLSQEQMIAALLYGQPFGDLDATQSSAVSNTSQAIAQKSVALGSLFLLASTPIESVSYNPDTGSFAAKVRLSEGTLLNVTTQEDKQQFGVRRSLGGNWSINTYIENDSQRSKQIGTALFEWIKRY